MSVIHRFSKLSKSSAVQLIIFSPLQFVGAKHIHWTIFIIQISQVYKYYMNQLLEKIQRVLSTTQICKSLCRNIPPKSVEAVTFNCHNFYDSTLSTEICISVISVLSKLLHLECALGWGCGLFVFQKEAIPSGKTKQNKTHERRDHLRMLTCWHFFFFF